MRLPRNNESVKKAEPGEEKSAFSNEARGQAKERDQSGSSEPREIERENGAHSQYR